MDRIFFVWAFGPAVARVSGCVTLLLFLVAFLCVRVEALSFVLSVGRSVCQSVASAVKALERVCHYSKCMASQIRDIVVLFLH